ncbi:MAG: glycosyltransferase family 10 [Nanoarchaeota archaeon]
MNKKNKLILINPNVIGYLKNKLFEVRKGYNNIETNLLFKQLKDFLENKGYSVETIDQHPLNQADYIIFFGINPFDPYFKKIKYLKQKNKLTTPMFVILWESPLINLYQYKPKNLRYFDKVLTWKTDIVDDKMFFKYFWPEQIIKKEILKIPFKDKKFISIINANKIALGEKELYSERKRAAKFFESTQEGISVYGSGWNERHFRLSLLGHMIFRYRYILKKIISLDFRSLKYLIEFLFNTKPLKSKTVKGIAKESCIEVLSKFKYAICFENAKDISGYSTEKIFNCFNARCVPVYLGDDEILQYIPEKCYINLRKFKNYEELYQYLKSIDEKKYNKYIVNINNFLNSNKTHVYSNNNFINTFYRMLIRNN